MGISNGSSSDLVCDGLVKILVPYALRPEPFIYAARTYPVKSASPSRTARIQPGVDEGGPDKVGAEGRFPTASAEMDGSRSNHIGRNTTKVVVSLPT